MDQPTKEWCIEHKLGLSAVRKKFPEFYSMLQERFPGLGVSEQLYIYFYGKPVCKICGKPVKYVNFVKGYWDCCSSKCHAQYATEARKKTCLERYGVEYSAAAPKTKEKIRKAFEEKYGGNPFANEDIKKKIHETCLDKYGVENPMENCEVVARGRKTRELKYGDPNYNNPEQARQTCLEKYGVEHTSKLKENREKAAQTNLERHGAENYRNTEQTKQTNLERYGVPYSSQAEEVKMKAVQTCLDHHGVPYGFLNTEPGYSKASQHLFNQLKKYFPNALYATKGGEYRVGPYLLDWYDPDSNTVIEFNGDYWHANPKIYNEKWIHPKCHCTAQSIWEKDEKKLDYLKSLGYKVIVVWESEADINKILEDLGVNLD